MRLVRTLMKSFPVSQFLPTSASNLYGRSHRSRLSFQYCPRRRPYHSQRRGFRTRFITFTYISQKLLGTNEILLVKHTGCGTLTLKDEDAVKIVEERLGEGAKKELESFRGDFQPFGHLMKDVQRDVQCLRGVKIIPEKVSASGWLYEVESGRLRSIV